MKKKKHSLTNSAISSLFVTSENKKANRHRYISQVAADTKPMGRAIIEYGRSDGSEIERLGLFALIGVIGAYTAVGYNTKSKMIDNMQACAPQLDRNFCGQLIDLITGTDPDTHMLRLYPDGTYDTIDIG